MRKLTFVSLSIVLAFAIAAIGSARAETPFFDFAGFSYLDGSPGEVGTGVTVVMRLNEIQPKPIWPLDFDLNEYTVYIRDLEISSVLSYGTLQEITYTGGVIEVFADPAKNSSYAPLPPNPSVPATFSDGLLELGGGFTELILFYDTASGVGTVSGTIDWTAGSRLAALENASGWTFFGGVSDDSGLGIPPGYDLAWDPQFYGPAPSPTESGSWGALKARFAR